MAHTLAGITIHPDDNEIAFVNEANYALQSVLDATSEVISYFGAKSERISLAFTLDEDVNSNNGLTTLRNAVKANSDVNFTTDRGSYGNVRILSLHASRRQALNHTGNVYKCTAELISTS